MARFGERNRSKARETARILPVEDDVVEKTIGHLPLVVADMVRFQRLAGCRPGEVCAITPSLVDRSNDVWKVKLVEHKTAWRGQNRTIYVGPKAQAVLAPYLLRGPDAHCFSPKESERKRHEKACEERVSPTFFRSSDTSSHATKSELVAANETGRSFDKRPAHQDADQLKNGSQDS